VEKGDHVAGLSINFVPGDWIENNINRSKNKRGSSIEHCSKKQKVEVESKSCKNLCFDQELASLESGCDYYYIRSRMPRVLLLPISAT
jgi:hypothetical protein